MADDKTKTPTPTPASQTAPTAPTAGGTPDAEVLKANDPSKQPAPATLPPVSPQLDGVEAVKQSINPNQGDATEEIQPAGGQKTKDGRKYYTLERGKHSWQDDNGVWHHAKPGDKVPLSDAQLNSFRDKFATEIKVEEAEPKPVIL